MNVYQNMSIRHTIGDVKMKAKIFEHVFNEAYEGIVIVNHRAQIIYINKAALEIVHMDYNQAINRYVTDVIPWSRLPIVLKTRKAEIGWPQKVGDRDGIVHRIPIIFKGKVVGAIGIVIFRDASVLEKIMARLKLSMNISGQEEDFYGRIGSSYSFENIIGSSEALKKVIEKAKKAANCTYNVLIKGETGTGKELFAHAIHSESQFASAPFVRVNCAAVPADMLESELFGHEKGAVEGTQNAKKGKLESAGYGTIFLDEITDLDLSLQRKLLAALEERKFERIGGSKSIPLNARIIASTNKDILRMCDEGTFSRDLYYRLNTIELHIPPLRERKEDIAELFEHFRKEYNVGILSKAALKLLLEYHWPGNVREMENLVKRLSVLSGDVDVIEPEHLLEHFVEMRGKTIGQTQIQSLPPASVDLLNTAQLSEKIIIENMLKQVNGNKQKAAKLLNISRTSLYNKIRKYKISVPKTPKDEESSLVLGE